MRHSEKEEREEGETHGEDRSREPEQGAGARRGVARGGGRADPVAGNQAGRRQVVRGRQWRGGVRNLGLNLALPLQGAGPPVHLDAKERRNEYAARAVIGPPRPPPPPPHYNFPNRILQSGPYSLAHKQFCFSALEPVNHAEREHLGRRRGPPRALPRAPHRAPPNGFVPGGRGVLGWRATGARCGVPRPGKMGNARRKRVRVWGAQRSGFEFRSDVFWLRPWATSPPPAFALWEMR